MASKTALKGVPAFDSKGVAGSKASGENEEFGNSKGSSVNFTTYSLVKAIGNSKAVLGKEIEENVRLLNPMCMMDEEGSCIAPHWYIRHGAIDRDTAFPIPINLATKLENKGKDVNFKLPWNRPHSGDYALNELLDGFDRFAVNREIFGMKLFLLSCVFAREEILFYSDFTAL